MPPESYTIGLDLGQSSDPTALAVVRMVERERAPPLFEVPHLQRLPLGTTYPGVIQHTKRLMALPPLRHAELVIDFTGVGRPVFDMFVANGLSPIGVAITGGDKALAHGTVWSVPKIMLISRLQALLHDGRLRVLKSLPEATVLAAELQDFRAEVTDTGRWTFGARAGKHDDLVLALAIALWRAYQGEQVAGFVDYFEALATTPWGKPLKLKHASEAEVASFMPPPPEPAEPQLVTLQAKPWSNFSIEKSIYKAGDDGRIEVAPEHVERLLKCGCARVDA